MCNMKFEVFSSIMEHVTQDDISASRVTTSLEKLRCKITCKSRIGRLIKFKLLENFATVCTNSNSKGQQPTVNINYVYLGLCKKVCNSHASLTVCLYFLP